MAYAAMDIARYVINYCIDKKKPISNLQLQKILYYIQAAFLVEEGKPCFEEDIVRWRHGPVQKEVYNNFKGFIGGSIEEKQNEYIEYIFNDDFSIKKVVRVFNENDINLKDKEIINKVINALIDIEAWDLVDRTHEEEPWKNSADNDIITIKSIKDFFNASLENESRIYGKY